MARCSIYNFEEECYHAYYEVFFGTSASSSTVLTDLSKDWAPGGYNSAFSEWALESSLNYRTRISFVTPILVKKGQTITVGLPDIECPTGDCANGCALITGYAVMEKIEGSNTGYIPLDYTVKTSKWANSYTAQEDVYILCFVKYNKHGSLSIKMDNVLLQDIVVTVK